MASESILTAYLGVCEFPVGARQRLLKNLYRSKKYTCNIIRNVELVALYVVHVLSKENKQLVLPITSWFVLRIQNLLLSVSCVTFLHLTKVAASSSNLQVVVLHVNCCVVCVVSPLGNTRRREPHKPTCGYWGGSNNLGETGGAGWCSDCELGGGRDGRGSKQTAGYHGNNY